MDKVINSLALQSCRNTHIGSVLARGISGGEVRLSMTTLSVSLCRGSHGATDSTA